MSANTYTMHLDGTIEVPGVSRDVAVAVEYGYEPGSGPVWPRGEPQPISPADPPEVDVRRVFVARQRVQVRKSSEGRVLCTDAEIESDWQDITDLLTTVLDGDDWREMRAEIADRHHDEALEGAAA